MKRISSPIAWNRQPESHVTGIVVPEISGRRLSATAKAQLLARVCDRFAVEKWVPIPIKARFIGAMGINTLAECITARASGTTNSGFTGIFSEERRAFGKGDVGLVRSFA